MRVEQLEITPEMALAMLQGNAGNRKADKSRIRQYAADMKAGRWKLSPQTVSIAADGRVVDGQHRLYALVDSDTTQPFLVVFDADAETFDVIDTGKTRSGNDIWRIAGTSAPNVAAVARLAYMYFNHRAAAWDGSLKVTSAQVLEWATNHNYLDVLRRAAKKEAIIRKDLKGLGAIVGASMAIAELAAGVDVEKTYQKVFDPLVKTLGFEEGQPVYALHRVLSKRNTYGMDNPFCPGLASNRTAKAKLAVFLQVVSDVFNEVDRQYYRPTMDMPMANMETALKSTAKSLTPRPVYAVT